MYELKQLSREAIPEALELAKHYRLLNEPGAAESICRDILRVDSNHQEALVTIILAMSDRLARDYVVGNASIQDYLGRIEDDYMRTYYTGIIYERRAKAILHKGPAGSESNAYEMFLQAMKWFEKAEQMRPPGNDDAILRWNGCVRVIKANRLEAREMAHDMLE